MKGFTKEIKIALVAILGIVVLFYGIKFLKGVTLFSSDNTYYITFTNISGLAGSSPVMTDGYKVGTVKSINFDYNKRGQIIAEVAIDKELRIPKGTTAEITSDLLGNVQVDLLMGAEEDGFLEPLETIQGCLNSGAMGKLKEMIPQVEKMLPKLDSILANINYILADPAIPSVVHHAEQVTNDLVTTTRQINSLMSGVNKNIPGLMGKADNMLESANNTMGHARTAVDNLNGKIEQLDLESTLNELTLTLQNLKSFTASLNDKKGSLGLLMNDRSLYDHLNSTMLHADSLMIDLKENPKRYVHFSVFGKKDKSGSRNN